MIPKLRIDIISEPLVGYASTTLPTLYLPICTPSYMYLPSYLATHHIHLPTHLPTCCTHPFIHPNLPTHPPTHLPTHTYLPTYPPTYPPTYLLYLLLYLPTYIPTHPPTYLPTHLLYHPPTYLPTYLSCLHLNICLWVCVTYSMFTSRSLSIFASHSWIRL